MYIILTVLVGLVGIESLSVVLTRTIVLNHLPKQQHDDLLGMQQLIPDAARQMLDEFAKDHPQRGGEGNYKILSVSHSIVVIP